MTTLPSIVQTAPFAPLTREQRDRLSTMRKATSEIRPGSFSISRSAAPTDDERTWLRGVRRALIAVMDPAVEQRDQIQDRLHVFLAGFPQLRTLDEEGGAMMLENFVEAVEGLPLEVVARAVKAWNQRKVQGVDYRFPPAPPEFRKAADDIMAALRVERRDVEMVMRAIAAPEGPAPITDEEREACLKRAAETVEGIVKAGEKLDAELSDASAAAARIEQAAYVERFRRAEAERKARIQAMRVPEGAAAP